MNPFETLIYEKINGTGYITLNRPGSLNVYNIRMRDELYEVLCAVRDDSEVKVVIVRATGDKAFCAGADLSEFLTAPPPIFARMVRFQRDVWGLFLSLQQPVIAALQGYVLGSGIEIALCCDIRIAAENVRFGLPEVGLGIIPAAGGTQTLPRNTGPATALDMFLTGRWLDAREALKTGLVNRVVPFPVLWQEVDRIANKIKSCDYEVISMAKQAVVRGLDMSLSEGLDLEKRLVFLYERRKRT